MRAIMAKTGNNMLKHNKKRNVGLMVEFLSRHIADCVLENKLEKIEEAKSIWVSNFVKAPQLAKEYALFNTLYKTTVKNREVAVSLMEKVKREVQGLDQDASEKQKTNFIKEVTQLSDKEFFNRPIEDYKTHASIAILMNMWKNESSDLATIADLEDKVLSHLLEEKQESFSPNVLKLKSKDVDALIVRLMKEKFEKKYNETLTESQKEIVRLHVLSESSETTQRKLQSMFQDLQKETLSLVEKELKESNDTILKEKLSNISELIKEAYSDTSFIDDDMTVFHMTLAKLVEELRAQ